MKLLITFSIIVAISLSACNSSSVDSTKTKHEIKIIGDKSTNSSTETVKEVSNNAIEQTTPVTNLQITDTYWKLVTLEGKAIKEPKNPHDQPHFMLNTKDKRASGNDSCNGFFGNYTLENGNRIKFNQIAGTKRFCQQTVVDQNQFLQVFAKTESYSIREGALELFSGEAVPLAVFIAVTNKDE